MGWLEGGGDPSFPGGLAERGYDVVGVDWRGFGHSEGKRGILGSTQ